MDLVISVAILMALWKAGAEVDAGIKHRRLARQNGRDVGSLWWHINQAAQAKRAQRKSRKTFKKTKPSESIQSTSNLDSTLSANRTAASEAMSSRDWKRNAEKARKQAGISAASAGNGWKTELRNSERKSSPPPPVRSQSAPSSARSSRGNLSFSYTAADGETTIREVSNWRADRTYIKGICVDRREERTFRRDRIDYFLSGEELLDEPTPKKPAPAPRVSLSPKKPEILFTGFDSAVRLELEDLAWDADMTIRQTVTKNLTYLIAGPRAGSTKLRQAGERGATVLDEEQFRHMIETGELLDY